MLGDMDKHLARKMFITTLFTINKILKQLKSTIRRNWLNKWWDIYVTEYYKAIKNNATECVLCELLSAPNCTFITLFFFPM